MSHWIDTLTTGWPVQPDLVRQWVGQVLLGAVNHEQSKRLSFSSLEWLIGPAIRSLNHQRHLLGELAGVGHTRSMLERNGRLLDLSGHDLFHALEHVIDAGTAAGTRSASACSTVSNGHWRSTCRKQSGGGRLNA